MAFFSRMRLSTRDRGPQYFGRGLSEKTGQIVHKFPPFHSVLAGWDPGGSMQRHCFEARPRTAGLVPSGRFSQLQSIYCGIRDLLQKRLSCERNTSRSWNRETGAPGSVVPAITRFRVYQRLGYMGLGYTRCTGISGPVPGCARVGGTGE